MIELLPGDPDWGNLADWVSGLATVGTLLVALAVLSREVADRQQQRDFERGAQARKVHVSSVRIESASGIEWMSLDRSYSFTVTNQSDDVIHDVKLILAVDASVLTKDSGPAEQHKSAEHLVPGESLRLDARFQVRGDAAHKRWLDSPVIPTMTFKDVTGQRWIRDARFRLFEVKPGAPRAWVGVHPTALRED